VTTTVRGCRHMLQTDAELDWQIIEATLRAVED
jgi:hypothetical protein